jgi:hypothetical protein
MGKFIIVLMQLLLISSGFGSVHAVPENFPTIQSALDICVEGDTVLVAQGTYNELLTIPPVGLSLVSNYIFSNDTLDINNTVLDGLFAGTVITIDQNRPFFILKGLTIKGGIGYWDSGATGGGLNIHGCDSLVLDHLIFEGMRSATVGAVGFIRMEDGNSQNLTMRNILIRDLNMEEPVSYASNVLKIRLSGNLYLENIEINGSGQSWPGLKILGDGKGFVKNFRAHNSYNAVGKPVSIQVYDSLYVEDFVVENNHFHFSEYSQMSFGGIGSPTAFGRYKRVYFRNNTIIGECGEDDTGSSGGIGGELIQADSIFFINNHSSFGRSCGSISGIGQISNIFVIGNSIGDAEWEGDPDENCPRGPHLEIRNCSVRNMIFNNNTTTLYQRPPESQDAGMAGAGTGGVMIDPYLSDIEFLISNCEFSDNFIVDHDIYENLPGEQHYASNKGRALYIIPSVGNIITIDSCLFVNNRQPNHVPEWQWWQFGGRYVGSTIEVESNINPDQLRSTVIFSNCEIRDNDDGGIFASGKTNVTLENVQIINTNRFGIRIEANHSTAIAKNVLIDGTIQQDNWFGFPDDGEWIYQSALSLLGDSIVAENITITNCDVPIMGIMNHSWDVIEAVTAYNLCYWNNQYDVWETPELPTEDYTNYEYSLLQEERPGSNNLIGVDPLFDPDLGAPYLAVGSPCIDAGDPSIAYNDTEDHANFGFALWPSQGSLRNDIGYTGGPGAAVFNFTGIEPQSNPNPSAMLPKATTLGNAYPNPFNPVTTIEFYLPELAEVKIFAYNLVGQQVRTLVDSQLDAGEHSVRFMAGDLASGVYFIHLESQGEQLISKVLLLK